MSNEGGRPGGNPGGGPNRGGNIPEKSVQMIVEKIGLNSAKLRSICSNFENGLYRFRVASQGN